MRRVTAFRTRRDQKGSALVEAALVILVYLSMMLGIMDIGQALFLRTSVTERVRVALRAGALAYDATAIKNHVLYGTRTPAAGARPAFNLTDSMVTVSRIDVNTSGDRLKIVIANYPLIFYTPFLARRVVSPPIYGVQQIETP